MVGISNEPNVADPTKTLFQDRAYLIKGDKEPLLEKWLFVACPENGGMGRYKHNVSPLNGNYANGGFLMIAPQQGVFDYLVCILNTKDRFQTQCMEQDLLNRVFSRKSPLPWRELHWKWSLNFVNQRDTDAGVHALHSIFWEKGPECVQKRWQDTFQKMIGSDAARRWKNRRSILHVCPRLGISTAIAGRRSGQLTCICNVMLQKNSFFHPSSDGTQTDLIHDVVAFLFSRIQMSNAQNINPRNDLLQHEMSQIKRQTVIREMLWLVITNYTTRLTRGHM